MALVSSVILIDNNRFGGVVQLENLAYDIALSVRQAQVSGIAVQRSGSGASSSFSSSYGVHFSLSSPQTYIIFEEDENGNGSLDSGEETSTYKIRSGFTITALCAPADATCNATSLTVAFRRPESDAWISASGNTCSYGGGSCAKSARIVLKSPRGDIMSVVVDANGQISVRRGASQ